MTNKVTLFSNGIADYRRQYPMSESKIQIPVKREHIADVISSLNIFGGVTLKSPPSYVPENGTNGKLELSSENVFLDLGKKLRGSKVEVTVGSIKTIGTLVGTDKEELATGGEAVAVYYYVLLTQSEGIKRFKQSSIDSIKFVDPIVQSEVDKALQRAFNAINPQSTTVSLEIESNGSDGEYTVQYTVPAAAWKMTYRLRETPEGTILQGVCAVDNNTLDDWKEITLAVVEGQPITFESDIAESKTPNRSRVNFVSDKVAEAVQVQPGYAPARRKSLGAAGGNVLRSMSLSGSEVCSLESVEGYGSANPAYEIALSPGTTLEEVGDFSIFEHNSPVTILAGQSATIPMFEKLLSNADTVLFFDPTKNETKPYRAVRFKNETGQNLGRGPCTVFQKGTYAGSADLVGAKKGENVVVCHAVETGVRVLVEHDDIERELISFKIAEGIFAGQYKQSRSSNYTLKNVKDESFKVILDHCCSFESKDVDFAINSETDGFSAELVEKLPSGVRFEITLPAQSEVQLSLTERHINEQKIVFNENVLVQYVQNPKSKLTSESGLKACIAAQKKISEKRQEIHDLASALGEVEQRQNRLKELLKVNSDEDWRRDLKASETEIVGLTAQRSTANKELVELNKKLTETLAKLKAEWSVE